MDTRVELQLRLIRARRTPLERSIQGAPEALVDSCRAYYAFMDELLADMLADPAAYGMNPGALEAHLKGRPYNLAQRQQPSKTQRLRTETQDCFGTYARFLLLLGQQGELAGEGLRLSPQDWEAARQRFDRALSGKGRNSDNRIPFPARLAALERAGLRWREAEGAMQITCPAHPEMFPAWQALARSALDPTVEPFGQQGFKAVDFRQAFCGHKPDYADVTQPLPPQARAAADDLNAYLSFRRCYPACETFWKVNYRYRGEQVAQLSQEAQGLIVRVNGVYRWEDQEGFNALLAEQDPAFQRFVLRHLCYCTACSTTHLGRFTQVLGYKKRVCGGGAIDIRALNPTAEQLDPIKRFIDLRLEMIDRRKGAERKKA